jgi:hypothetical protein
MNLLEHVSVFREKFHPLELSECVVMLAHETDQAFLIDFKAYGYRGNCRTTWPSWVNKADLKLHGHRTVCCRQWPDGRSLIATYAWLRRKNANVHFKGGTARFIRKGDRWFIPRREYLDGHDPKIIGVYQYNILRGYHDDVRIRGITAKDFAVLYTLKPGLVLVECDGYVAMRREVEPVNPKDTLEPVEIIGAADIADLTARTAASREAKRPDWLAGGLSKSLPVPDSGQTPPSSPLTEHSVSGDPPTSAT